MPEASDDGDFRHEISSLLVPRSDAWDTPQKPPALRSVDRSAPNGFPAQLLGAISREVLPRMIEAHSPIRANGADGASTARVGERDVVELADLAMSRDPGAALAMVEKLRAMHGHGVETICIQLLSPAAKRLGWLWDHDYCSFIDVTVGLGRLQRILLELRDHAWSDLTSTGSNKPRPRALIMPCSGEQHTLGPQIVGECFRLDGWEVWAETPTSTEQMVALVRTQWFDAIGFSASSTQTRETVIHDVSAARAASKNPDVLLLVGGPLFAIHPELVDAVGADAMTSTGDEAPILARHLLSLTVAGER